MDNTNPPADQEITWGGQQPPRKNWSRKKTVAAVAIAVGVAAAGGIAVYAASGSAGAQTTAMDGRGGGPGGMRGGGFGGPGGGMTDALHGTFTVSDGNGGYKTAIMQTGQVTAVTDTSLTAKSDDGYTKVYTFSTSTTFDRDGSKSDVKTGDTVTVVATPNGDNANSDNATADSVIDRSQMGAGQGGPPQG